MIGAFILEGAYQLFSWIISALPDSTGLPEGFSSAVIYMFSAINSFSYIIPVGALFNAMIIVALYEGVVWTFFGILWVWKRIPFIGK